MSRRRASSWSGCNRSTDGRGCARAGRSRDAKTALAAAPDRRHGRPPGRLRGDASRGGTLGRRTERRGVIVGIPKEVKDNEFRVAATPEGSASSCTRATASSSRPARVTARRSRTTEFAARGCRDRPGCRRRLRRCRHDPQGEGAAAAGVRAVPGGADPVHVPASGGRRGLTRFLAERRSRRRVRDRAAPGRPAPAPGADERDRRPDGAARAARPTSSGPRAAAAC